MTFIRLKFEGMAPASIQVSQIMAVVAIIDVREQSTCYIDTAFYRHTVKESYDTVMRLIKEARHGQAENRS